MNNLHEMLMRMPLEEIAGAIRARDFSVVEMVEGQLQQIERLNPRLNAIVTLAPDVLERAGEADAALARGLEVGPLHGIPITIKDTIETKGLRSTSGSLMRSQFVPEEDAPAVARLKAAGAIVVGKTNVSEMAMGYDADNPLFGRTNNPHDLRYSSGGSSGGEAASIAAGLSFAGVGSDLAGSIRIPAHFCGIAGLKPTTGSVPAEGQCPPAVGPFSLGAVIGPMARRVADLGILFRVLAGLNTSSSGSTSKESQEKLIKNLQGRRAVWYAEDEGVPVAEEIRKAVESAALVLEDAGMVVENVKPPGIERGPELWSRLFSRAAFNHLKETYAGHEEKGGPIVQAMFKAHGEARPQTIDEFIETWVERDRLRSLLVRWMKKSPLILAPVGVGAAFPHNARKLEVEGEQVSLFRAFGFSQTFNAFDFPSACVPAGRSAEGFPIGVQVVGRPFEEESVLAAAQLIEEALGGWQPPAILSSGGHHPL